MRPLKNVCLSIGGYDPSGGAGVLADVKTFEQIGVMSAACITCVTYQNEEDFLGIEWLDTSQIRRQLEPVFAVYKIEYAKIGLVKNITMLKSIISLLTAHNKKIKIIWDPVLSSTSGFEFHKNISLEKLKKTLTSVYAITPNIPEVKKLTSMQDEIKASKNLSAYTNVILKGGHSKGNDATDILFTKNSFTLFAEKKINDLEKHGSGCVFSSAFTAALCMGKKTEEACISAKEYTLAFLKSHPSKKGKHSGILK